MFLKIQNLSKILSEIYLDWWIHCNGYAVDFFVFFLHKIRKQKLFVFLVHT